MRRPILEDTRQIALPGTPLAELAASEPSLFTWVKKEEADLSGREKPLIIGAEACTIPAISANHTTIELHHKSDGSLRSLGLRHCLEQEPQTSTSVLTEVEVGAVDPKTNTRDVKFPVFKPCHQDKSVWQEREGITDFVSETVTLEFKSDLTDLAHRHDPESCRNADGSKNEFITAGDPRKGMQRFLIIGRHDSKESGPHTADHTVFTHRFKVELPSDPASEPAGCDPARKDSVSHLGKKWTQFSKRPSSSVPSTEKWFSGKLSRRLPSGVSRSHGRDPSSDDSYDSGWGEPHGSYCSRFRSRTERWIKQGIGKARAMKESRMRRDSLNSSQETLIGDGDDHEKARTKEDLAASW